jgi:hypothetical protein
VRRVRDHGPGAWVDSRAGARAGVAGGQDRRDARGGRAPALEPGLFAEPEPQASRVLAEPWPAALHEHGHMDRDVADLIDKRKIPVYVVEEDLTERGIERRELISGVKLLSRAALPGVCDEHAIVSLW